MNAGDHLKDAAGVRQTPKRPSPLSVRLTDEERARLERDAGSMSLNAYIRERLFGEDVAPRSYEQWVRDEIEYEAVLRLPRTPLRLAPCALRYLNEILLACSAHLELAGDPRSKTLAPQHTPVTNVYSVFMEQS